MFRVNKLMSVNLDQFLNLAKSVVWSGCPATACQKESLASPLLPSLLALLGAGVRGLQRGGERVAEAGQLRRGRGRVLRLLVLAVSGPRHLPGHQRLHGAQTRPRGAGC